MKGEDIYWIRSTLKLSMDEMAKAVHTVKSTIREIENIDNDLEFKRQLEGLSSKGDESGKKATSMKKRAAMEDLIKLGAIVAEAKTGNPDAIKHLNQHIYENENIYKEGTKWRWVNGGPVLKDSVMASIISTSPQLNPGSGNESSDNLNKVLSTFGGELLVAFYESYPKFFRS